MPSTSRRFAVLALLGTVPLFVSACSGPAVVTCEEFAALGDSTGLFVQLNDEQDSALRAALDAEGFDTSARNRQIAQMEVIAFCNIYDGQAGNNPDRLISEAL